MQAGKLRKAGARPAVTLWKRGGNAKAHDETRVKTNEAKLLVRTLPTADQVAEWVRQAKTLPGAIPYQAR